MQDAMNSHTIAWLLMILDMEPLHGIFWLWQKCSMACFVPMCFLSNAQHAIQGEGARCLLAPY